MLRRCGTFFFGGWLEAGGIKLLICAGNNICKSMVVLSKFAHY